MSFGRKGAVPGTADELAARRAAFLAEERARAAQPAAARAEASLPPIRPDRTYAAEKSTGIAYLLWFFFGGIGGHRFYLGFTGSGFVQLLLAPLGYVMVFSKEPMGFLLVIAAGLWILSDAFFIPSMVRKANARARGQAYNAAFA